MSQSDLKTIDWADCARCGQTYARSERYPAACNECVEPVRETRPVKITEPSLAPEVVEDIGRLALHTKVIELSREVERMRPVVEAAERDVFPSADVRDALAVYYQEAPND